MKLRIVGQTTTHLLSNTNTVFLSNLGDHLSYTTFSGTVQGSGGWITQNTTYENGQPSGSDVSIGGFNFGVDSNMGFSVGFGAYGGMSSIGISSDGYTFSNSYTSNGSTAGQTTTFKPGGYAVLAVLAGIVCVVTDGVAVPIFSGF